MNLFFRSLTAAGLVLALAAPRLPAQQPPPGVEIQARGPVHEAFAQPNLPTPQGPAEAAPKQPPPPVPELPPEQRPQGANVEWLPGYWQWDAGTNEFVWVTGAYRNAPPGRRWVPGQWVQTDQGWQWVHGYWAPAGQDDPAFLPQPPAPRDDGAAPPAPNDNAFYIPGTWQYQQNQYAWRPGFWSAAQPGWVFNPPQYYWTPRNGYAYVDGYWDYPLANRGLLFAPVVFTRPLWATPGWAYRPAYVVSPAALLNAFWVRPGAGYYFGNYYGPAYARAGLQPWHAWGPRAYDPLYNYYRWQNRANPQWAAGLRTVHADRVTGRAPLPPNTLTQQLARTRTAPPVVTPLSQASQLRTVQQRAGSTTTLRSPANGNAAAARAGTTTYRAYYPSAQTKSSAASAAARKVTVNTSPAARAPAARAAAARAPTSRPAAVSAARYRAPAAAHAPSGGRGGGRGGHR